MPRLNKHLADLGYGSRRACDRFIAEGKVFVNGKRAKLGTIVTDHDEIEVEGEDPAYAKNKKSKPIVIALHKPKGYITTADERNTKTVFDLVDIPQRLFPVGRLDVDSSGLLLLTNDGALANFLMHPRYEHEKEYSVETNAPIRDADIITLRNGIVLDGKKTLPAGVKRVSETRLHIRLREGRNRQIRRMIQSIGNKVKTLVRIRVASVELGHLPVGKWRRLTDKEIKTLQES
ncbi:MAG: pseudouridine synthase [Patescibacteria group bacterium]